MIEEFSACLIGDFDRAVDKETLVAVGQAHVKIIETARERNASMIVMATHGKTGIGRALMGGVAEKVVRLAPCPVYCVRPKDLEISEGG